MLHRKYAVISLDGQQALSTKEALIKLNYDGPLLNKKFPCILPVWAAHLFDSFSEADNAIEKLNTNTPFKIDEFYVSVKQTTAA